MQKNNILIIFTITLSLFVHYSQSYRFKNGHHLNITSYYKQQEKNIHITIYSYHQPSSVSNQQDTFFFYSPQIAESKHPISIKHSHSFFVIQPPIPHAKIISNYKKQHQYILQISHPYPQFHNGIPFNKNTQFLLIQILSHKQQQDFLLPILSQQMPFIPAHSLFYCQDMIIAVDVSEGVQDVSVFSHTPVLHLKGPWDWALNKDHFNFYNLHYNRVVRSNVNQMIRIILHKNDECQIDSELFKTSQLDVHLFMQRYEQKAINFDILKIAVIQVPIVKGVFDQNQNKGQQNDSGL